VRFHHLELHEPDHTLTETDNNSSSVFTVSTSSPHFSLPTGTEASPSAPPATTTANATTIYTPTTLHSSANSTITSNVNGSTPGICTGCVLEAAFAITTSFENTALTWTSKFPKVRNVFCVKDMRQNRCASWVLCLISRKQWPSILDLNRTDIMLNVGVVVTETVITSTISYFTGTPEVLETVVTSTETLNQTKTIVGTANQTISHTQPFFTITPTNGVELTVPIGSTYVYYQVISGGLDSGPTRTIALTNPTPDAFKGTSTVSECHQNVDWLLDATPTATADWYSYIQTISEATKPGSNYNYPIPPGLVDYLKKQPAIQKVFGGSDIATCTVETTTPTTTEVTPTTQPPAASSPTSGRPPFTDGPGPDHPPPPPPPPGPPTPPQLTTEPPAESTSIPGVIPITTSTWLSTTYQSTSTHVTVRGCLRCEPGPTDQMMPNPQQTDEPSKPPHNPVPAMPNSPSKPDQALQPSDEPRVTIGGSVYVVGPAAPTQGGTTQTYQPGQTQGSPVQPNQPGHTEGSPTQPNGPNQPGQDQQNNQNKPTGIIIGTNTLTWGQTTTWNGVQVIVPSSGGGSTIMVGGSSVAVHQAATAPPVLTVGDKTMTANPQGQFVVGTQTLAPGSPAVTIDGTTLQLGPSGTVAIVNGQTQSLGHAPLPTNAPAIMVNGQIFSASVMGGTTVFAMGSQTLTPGGVLTKDGTTFSMPANGDGSTVVVNGVTSTLAAPGLPVLTIGNEDSKSAITASVQGGTTAFVLAPGQTLTPGGAITVSGTTYSLPASASGSIVVINGETSTLGSGPITAAAALTIEGKTYSATVRDGTTEFVLSQGTTLKPGASVVVSGTTYSLDPKGTALVVDGKTSTIPRTPASNAASTTASPSNSISTEGSRLTTSRDPGEYIASGLGISSSKAGAGLARIRGVDGVVEGAVMGLAGWLLMLL
jgi:hypothetical protein